jgi:eukaryotic-like serine/threonine-protein kinase
MTLTADVVQRALGRVGTLLRDKWRLDEVLGVGGMATVYAATHRNKKRVAIKMLHTELSIDENIKSRFLREGYVANTVGHPGAVTVLDDDIAEDGSAFLVMELLEGETLEMRTERKGKVPPGEVLALTDQLLDVLATAHEKGIVHRDIKPENLFFTIEGRLKVLDFGIAQLRDQTTVNVTGTGSFMGTPMFMSPEHARGRWKEVDAQSDIWAVGATMFMMLSGRGVHVAETVNDQLILAATAHAPSIATVVGGLPDSVVNLIDRALAFDKADRWPTARSMQSVLRQAAADLSAARSEPREAGDGPPTSSGPGISFRTAPLSPELLGAVSQRGTLLSKRGETLASSATAIPSETEMPSEPRPRSRPAVLAVLGAVAMVTVIGMLGLVRFVARTPAGSLATPLESTAPGPATASLPALTAHPPPAEPPAVEAAAPSAPEPPAEPAAKPDAGKRTGPRGPASRPVAAVGASATPPAGEAAPSAPPKPPAGTASPFDRRF